MFRYDKHIEAILAGQAQAGFRLRIGQALCHRAMRTQNYC